MSEPSKNYWWQADTNYTALVSYARQNQINVYEWLLDNLGLPGEDYYLKHGVTGLIVKFKEEKNYIWFVLRWS
jgi:hypothetical protein